MCERLQSSSISIVPRQMNSFVVRNTCFCFPWGCGTTRTARCRCGGNKTSAPSSKHLDNTNSHSAKLLSATAQDTTALCTDCLTLGEPPLPQQPINSGTFFGGAPMGDGNGMVGRLNGHSYKIGASLQGGWDTQR
jgi:hypothetical protein